MDDTTKKIILTLGAGLLKKVGIAIGMSFATHGWISGNDVELVGAGAVALGSAGYSFWNDYGKAIVLSQLEVLKAKSLAQAQQANRAGLPPVTVGAIAEQSPTLTPNDVSKVVAKLLIAVFVMSAFLAGAPAFAQAPKLTGNIAKDIATATAKPAATGTTTADPGSLDNAFSNFNSKVQTITKELVDKAIADVTAAQTDAQKHNDAISKPCWDSTLTLLQSLPTQWETPPTTIGIALGIQIQRDLLNSITGNDAASLKVACAALWGDQLKIVANVAGLLGIRIATGGLF